MVLLVVLARWVDDWDSGSGRQDVCYVVRPDLMPVGASC
jgi:hypothetical protein